eukprot:CAMPEP_0182893176 /NCGR_PEP_ID=MMETSP0034_2-20130328/24318_1 /TAXON_ID=156128 /ORGANISM="Nephroselmis pyriformis, Strain CCMP717" /LENGTH=62 /DNA_ID=CAMNT_0025026903 /DNA_START=57 /DNA_END=242 /DNA_ORIENTATION=+
MRGPCGFLAMIHSTRNGVRNSRAGDTIAPPAPGAGALAPVAGSERSCTCAARNPLHAIAHAS